jgi:hypothetical protein
MMPFTRQPPRSTAGNLREQGGEGAITASVARRGHFEARARLELEPTGVSLAKMQEIHARNARRYRTMLLEKKRLSFDEIEAQTALELPDREMLTLVRIGNVLTGAHIDVTLKNVNIAAQICAVVDLINVQLFTVNTLSCQVLQ